MDAADNTEPAPPGSVVVIGAGLAGLFTALRLAERGVRVTVVSPTSLGEGASSAWAQGGIAAAVGLGDTPDAHAADTMAVGGGLVDRDVAMGIARDAPDRIRDLLAYGVPFDRDLEGHYVLSREAAHSKARVVRVSGDRAGHAIMQALIAAVRKAPEITVLEGFTARRIDPGETWSVLLEPVGARSGDDLVRLAAIGALVLATGGIGGLYRVTTNPPLATGSGIAMAARAGATIIDAEFVQFHPTAIDVPVSPAPLASEALRGDGAVLVNRAGERFMKAVHPDAELAPRDIVARAVFAEIVAGRGAFLDCRDAIGTEFPERFPTVTEKCRASGIDPVMDLIPVVPAEHYHMGGVKTDAQGRTGVPGLYAVGEVGATGLHGANRLASNSLLEAVVIGARVADDIASTTGGRASAQALVPAKGEAVIDPARREDAVAQIRTLMSECVGVVRDDGGLRRALQDLRDVQSNAEGDLAVENMVVAGKFVTEAALRRRESRGGHFRSDYPGEQQNFAKRASITMAGLDLRDAAAARTILTGIANAGRSLS